MHYISRIKTIKNIGSFVDCSAHQFQFEKLTFIFGENTTGKTTLTDIFRSLKKNDVDIINKRRTISENRTEQRVELLVLENNQNTTINFINNSWNNLNSSKNLEIFGTEFVNKNIFTNSLIERENKENFTKFIIGEDGVVLADKIVTDKQKSNKRKSELKDKLPAYIKLENNEFKIKEFLNFPIEGLSIEGIEEKLIGLRIKKKNEEERLAEPTKILNLPDISTITLTEFNIQSKTDALNSVLETDYSNQKQEEFLKQLELHISNNFKEKENGENWIKDGFTKFHKEDNCIFCGQSLEGAKNLIEVYNSYFFDELYTGFVEHIKNDLQTAIMNFKGLNFSYLVKFQTQLMNTQNYKELVEDKSFQENTAQLENKLNKIDEQVLVNLKSILIEKIEIAIIEKNNKPYKKSEIVNFDDFKQLVIDYEIAIRDINDLIEKLQEEVNKLKDKYKDTNTIETNILILANQIKDLEYQKARVEQNDDCVFYLKEKLAIAVFDEAIKTYEEALETNQQEYVDKYFLEINKLFRQFGGHSFDLEKHQSNRGHLKTYSIKVKFKDREINGDDLDKVFSESDRRALGLSIFLAKINLKTEEEKSKTIIILDDPITSFDDHRARDFNLYLKDIYSEVSQIIIFTHYLTHLSSYYKHTEIKPKTFKIEKTYIGSKFDDFDFDKFIKSDYENLYIEIMAFIEGRTPNLDSSKPRTFIEKFYKPIFETIVGADLCNRWYIECSSDSHHIANANNTEQYKNFLRRMMYELYNFEIRNN